jgi:ATP-dependent DNA helicase RecG
MAVEPGTEITYLPGVGPARAELFRNKGIHTVEDLLSYLPFRYEDRIHFQEIAAVPLGTVATVLADVMTGGMVRFPRSGLQVYHLAVRDRTGTLHCKWFHSPYLQRTFKPAQRVVLHGKLEFDRYRPGQRQMIQPEFEILRQAGRGASQADARDSTEIGRIVPIYEAVGQITSRVLRRIIFGALERLATLADWLPEEVRLRHDFPERRAALQAAHFPASDTDLKLLNSFATPAHRRLIFEEFFQYQVGLALRRRKLQASPGIPFRVREDSIRAAVKQILPFKPTSAQKRVLAEIVGDMERPHPMNRLLQGDVGSGKTIVALESAVIAFSNASQVALMAPTEILAVQHFLYTRNLFRGTGYRVELLISGMPASEKKEAKKAVAAGEAHLVVGTHALIEEDVRFARLGLVIIDEQHRFGVLQRKRLMEKGGWEQAAPDVLVMTATPIPRTLALTLFGDLDISVIDEMPPGRTPIETRWLTEERIHAAWEIVRREVAAGRQAYIVYPVIEESKRELKAAVKQFEILSRQTLPNLRLALLHGQMPSEEKESVMERFRSGEIQVLVSTSVIEVGVDVPNATVMVIEHAENFGLAQLHQLRGRIGRGAHRSFCLLVSPERISDEARERLETMVRTTDGFAIAEVDLKLRGPGEFFGTRQSGLLSFHVANPIRDHELLELARREAFAWVANPAAAHAVETFRQFLSTRWRRHYALAEVL